MKHIPCSVKRLPASSRPAAAKLAVSINPANAPSLHGLASAGVAMTPLHIAVATTSFWGPAGVHLTVAFMEPTAAILADRILSHMNAWSQYCNVSFAMKAGPWQNADVRISRGPGGYYSYLGSDILHIPKNQQTMNLEGFTMQTPESEYHRVVRHETGHTLGCQHEHMRREIVAKLDPAKTTAYFGETQGWTPLEVQQQVLTPIEESSLMGTPHAEMDSIMCYGLPASITLDGVEILGGTDITQHDGAFMGTLYPLTITAPPGKPPITINPNGASIMDIVTFLQNVQQLLLELKAQNYLAAFQTLLALLNAIATITGAPAQAMQHATNPAAAKTIAVARAETMSISELRTQIEQHAASLTGTPLIDALQPLLIALAKKLLGF